MEGMAVFRIHLAARRGFIFYHDLLFSQSEQGPDRVAQASNAGRGRLSASIRKFSNIFNTPLLFFEQ
jgi:hypothetical protein